ncbi:MAG: CRISPR-associated helicase Cas3', partial [Cyanobacteria bacterium]|nr:CRISPR-associated helicase Cas3' [Cyanobacteriota bacterium]
STEDEAITACETEFNKKGRVLWVCNTVAQAQRITELLRSRNIPAHLYHSRFKYEDRVEHHRTVVNEFSSSELSDADLKCGIVAVTTQVAEMSLDLDATLLITEIAPIPSLIQRLGRLNRRIKEDDHGKVRLAIFIEPPKARPYSEQDLLLAKEWITELRFLKQLRQVDLTEAFNKLFAETDANMEFRTGLLDSGWFAVPEPCRDVGNSVSVIMKEDEQACAASSLERIKKTIPMNFHNQMLSWKNLKGSLIAPTGSIEYHRDIGAKLVWK